MHRTVRLVCSSFALVAGVLLACPAFAQPGNTQPAANPAPAPAPYAQPAPAPAPAPYAQPAPPQPAPYAQPAPPQPDPYAQPAPPPEQPVAEPAPDPGAEVPPVDEGPPMKNWALGLYASALSLTSDTLASNQVQLLGLGAHAWRRVHPRIDVGLAGARLSGETFTGATRQTTLFEVMARGHILPDGKWNPYATLGIGLTSDKVLADNGQEVASFNGTYLELGAGVEHRWNDALSAGAELHMIKAARGGNDPSEQVPQKASGYQLRLQLTYRFHLPI